MALFTSGDAKTRLASALSRVIDLRNRLTDNPELAWRVKAVKRWQAQRLRSTYQDLLSIPRYRLACEFFLDELYGTRDFSQRDSEALRVVPMLAKLLPERATLTLAMGCELDELSERLDARVAGLIMQDELRADTLSDEGYAAAYRTAGTRPERERQIAQIVHIGQSLDKLARLPLISGMLHLMRGPAEAAGLSHLHEFLSQGFDAFKAMGGATDFLNAVRERETALMNALLEGAC